MKERDFLINSNQTNNLSNLNIFQTTKTIHHIITTPTAERQIVQENRIESKKENDESPVKIETDFSAGVKIKINDDRYKKYIVRLYYFWRGEWLLFFQDDCAACGFEYENCINSFDWKCIVYKYENKKLDSIYEKIHNQNKL